MNYIRILINHWKSKENFIRNSFCSDKYVLSYINAQQEKKTILRKALQDDDLSALFLILSLKGFMDFVTVIKLSFQAGI